eukprot:CAMPEP_0182421004 /NCGR_PEP_ID=MMETSP1167-20130531/6153_1 /TAXON_ID=2988 /ORGANISM="Mallomonas Sp, Strain CCMP3275" /LENGTH=53 /DNA_ID=CAMNT_0024597661 /DNA_START=88 /DNA_END=249 /DNA_ORIENTATION=-
MKRSDRSNAKEKDSRIDCDDRSGDAFDSIPIDKMLHQDYFRDFKDDFDLDDLA